MLNYRGISIRAPARGATRCGRFYPVLCIDFNPRSREGSDRFRFQCLDQMYISIRAPTRGATYGSNALFSHLHISIRAPTRGATLIPRLLLYKPRNFNPRSHEGSDTVPSLTLTGCSHFNPRSHEGSDPTLRRYFIHFLISIRAPTRGATRRVFGCR